MNIFADNTVLRRDGSLLFEGAVRATRKDWLITADRIERLKKEQKLQAKQVRIESDRWEWEAASAEIHESRREATVGASKFRVYEGKLQGAAAAARLSPDHLEMDRALFSLCPPGREVWWVETRELSLDIPSDTGVARDLRFYLGGVPILWLPWISFPVSNKGKTGLLSPGVKYTGSDGLSYRQPYHIQLAPNYDLTLALKHITRRGTSLESHFRYLSRNSLWQLNTAWLDADRLAEEEFAAGNSGLREARDDRWLQQLRQRGFYGDGLLSTYIDYSRVSDPLYEQDIDPKTDLGVADDYLDQRFGLQLNLDRWRLQAGLDNSQALRNFTPHYRREPWFSLDLPRRYKPFRLNPFFDLRYANYDHSSATISTGRRLYHEGGLIYPMRWRSASLDAQLRWRHLELSLDEGGGSDKVTAASWSLDGRLHLQRRLADGNWLQILEPRLYYLYNGRKRQTADANFDTQKLEFTTAQLFRDTRFSGTDRLDDTHQLSLAVHSRLFDVASGRQWVTVTIGQIFYFSDRQVELDTDGESPSLETAGDRSSSPIAMQLEYTASSHRQLDIETIWDPDTNRIESGYLGFSAHSATGERRFTGRYRYARPGLVSEREESQLQFSAVLPMGSAWRLSGKWHYDTKYSQDLELEFGIRYRSCCWSAEISVGRSLEGLDDYDNSIQLRFSLLGREN